MYVAYIWMFMNQFGINLDNRSSELYVLILVCHSNFDSRSQGCEKANTFAQIISQMFLVDLDGIWYAVETIWSV